MAAGLPAHLPDTSHLHTTRMSDFIKMFKADTGNRDLKEFGPFDRDTDKYKVFAEAEIMARQHECDCALVVLTSRMSDTRPGAWYIKVGISYADALRILAENERDNCHPRRTCYLIKCSS